jgi:hypothetical protein
MKMVLVLSLVCTQSVAWAHFIFIPHITFRHLSVPVKNGAGHPVRRGGTTTTTTTTTTTMTCIRNCGTVGNVAPGEKTYNCVGPDARVGDNIVQPDGRITVIDTIYGNSDHCKSAKLPVRVATVLAASPPELRTTNARIDVPDGWEQRPLTDVMKANGSVLSMYNKESHTGLVLSTIKRDHVSDMAAFADSRLRRQLAKLTDAQPGPITTMEINGIPAWRFEVAGRTKSGTMLKYMNTLFEGEEEAVVLSAWTSAEAYDGQRELLANISDSLSGVGPQPGDKNEEGALSATGQAGPAVDDTSM